MKYNIILPGLFFLLWIFSGCREKQQHQDKSDLVFFWSWEQLEEKPEKKAIIEKVLSFRSPPSAPYNLEL